MPFQVEDFEKLDNYCAMDNDFDYDSNTGYAYKYKGTKMVFCLKDCDIDRGRGTPERCKGEDCRFFIHETNRPKITDFFKGMVE